MLQFFKDMNVNPNGFETLAIAWDIKCSEMGLYKKSEFINHYSQQNCTTIQDIKNYIRQIIDSLSETETFKEFYKWLFVHCKEDEKKKTIPTELALQLWKIVFEPKKKIFPLSHSWLKFVEENKNKDEFKSISRDIWEQLLDFLQEVKDVENYNEDGAWPVAVDEFIDYLKNE